MRTVARIRTSSALWASPVALGVVLFYAMTLREDLDRFYTPLEHTYAPLLVSQALNVAPVLAYAASSALSAWEAGRLKRDHVWDLAPARHRVNIAASAVAPVIALSWLMVLIPAVGVLMLYGTEPSWTSLPIVAMPMLISLAHAAIGFTAGTFISRFIISPLLAVGVFFLVAGAASYPEFWKRHISGRFSFVVDYGEALTLISFIPHVLTAFGVAVGLVLVARPVLARARVPVALTGCVLLIGGPFSSYLIVKDWGHHPPLSGGHVPTACVAGTPDVCGPDDPAVDLHRMQRRVAHTLSSLTEAGMPLTMPKIVTDSIITPGGPHSTTAEWRIPLYATDSDQGVEWSAMHGAIDSTVGCPANPSDAYASILLWSARVIGQEEKLVKARKSELFGKKDAQLARIRPRVEEIYSQGSSAQRSWYRTTTHRACKDFQ